MPIVTYSWESVEGSDFVNTYTSGDQSLPTIVRTNGGNSYYVAWYDGQGAVSGRGISNHLDFLTGETLVNQTTTNTQTDPSVAQLISTSIFNFTPPSIVVTYTDYSVDAGGDIRARFISAGPGILGGGTAYGTPGSEIEISTTTSDDSDSDVAALADGGFVVSFTRDFGAGDLDTRATILNANGTVRTALVVGDSSSTLSTSHTQVAGLTNGNFVMVWEQEPIAGGDTEVVYRIFDPNGVAVTGATIIDTYGSVNEDIQIVALADGGFAVAYADNGWSVPFLPGFPVSGAGVDISLAIYNSDGSVRSNAVLVNSTVAGDQGKPTLTTLSNGFIVVGWNNGTSTSYQAYTSQGVAIGSNYNALGSSVEAEIAGLSGGLLANVRESTVSEEIGSGHSIRTSIDELVRTTLGDATNETLLGDSLRDIINGAGGDDIISGGANADVVTGGAGSDVFRDSGFNLNGDTIVDFSLGDRIQVTGANIDTFTYSQAGGVLTFSGGSLTLSSVPVDRIVARAAEGAVELVVHDAENDFNGDGRSDILWRNDAGQFQQWQAQLNGGFVSNPNASGSAPTNWFIAATGDYNGDGRDDIVWRSSAGDFQEWLGQTNGGFVGNPNASGTAPTNWSIAGTGDFDGDGRDDILWRSTTGDFQEWLGQANGGFVGNPNASGFVPTNYQVTAVGDFNGDGHDDIVWRANDGGFVEWLAQANGGFANNPFASGSAPSNWHVVGAGDFNGDGRDDILWRSSTGDFQEWMGQTNGGFTANPFASGTVPTSWQIDAIGDYNGDGRDDILWRSAAGDFQEWLAQSNGGFVGNPNATGFVPTDWHVQSPNIFF